MTSLKIIQVRHIQLICVFGCAKNLNEVKNLWKITREILRFFTQWLANIGEIPDNLALKIPWTVFLSSFWYSSILRSISCLFLVHLTFSVHFLSIFGLFSVYQSILIAFLSILIPFLVYFQSIFGLSLVHLGLFSV